MVDATIWLPGRDDPYDIDLAGSIFANAEENILVAEIEGGVNWNDLSAEFSALLVDLNFTNLIIKFSPWSKSASRIFSRAIPEAPIRDGKNLSTYVRADSIDFAFNLWAECGGYESGEWLLFSVDDVNAERLVDSPWDKKFMLEIGEMRQCCLALKSSDRIEARLRELIEQGSRLETV